MYMQFKDAYISEYETQKRSTCSVNVIRIRMYIHMRGLLCYHMFGIFFWLTKYFKYTVGIVHIRSGPVREYVLSRYNTYLLNSGVF